MNVLIAGGGTGGHLFPGIAVAEELRRRDPTTKILFVGTARGIEVRAVPRAGFELALLPVSGLRGRGLSAALKTTARLPLALWEAMRLVRRFRPQVAVSVGGYAAGPAVLAAKLLGVRTVVMEQNTVAGWTNRLLGKFADQIFAGLPTEDFSTADVRVVGNPIRGDLLSLRDEPYGVTQPLQLLVFGGSQGAQALNNALLALMAEAPADFPWQIVHQTGPREYEKIAAVYADKGYDRITAVPFIDDMASAYRNAHLVVCRSGAMTLAELAVCGRPAILVPFPFAVDDHQTHNAKKLEDVGAAVHLGEGDLSATRLLELLNYLAEDTTRLETMAARAHAQGKPTAAQDIVDVLEGLAGRGNHQENAHV